MKLAPCYAARRLYSTHSAGTTAPGTSDDDASDLIWGAVPEEEKLKMHNPTSSVEPNAATNATRADGASPEGAPFEDSGSADKAEAEATGTPSAGPAAPSASPSPQPSTSASVWVTLHNMPRNWLHEEIAEMIHHVAAHAGIAAPHAHPEVRGRDAHDDQGVEDADGSDDMMTGRVSSPFIERLHIPFGRRTGLVYGTPKLLLTSRALADYLVRDLNFDPDDFRSRVYFTHTTPAELPAAFQQQSHDAAGQGGEASPSGRASVQYAPIEETVEREQDEALRTLELDRYLFAPDLLLDIAKSHQRRLVTKNEKVLLDAFVDGDEDDDEADEDASDAAGERDADAGDEGGFSADAAPQRAQRRRRSRSAAAARRRGRGGRPARAGTLKHLGRGSMHNMPIPKPYVEGRQL